MQRPSIAGLILLSLFGLPFAGFGLVFAAVSARGGSNNPGFVGVIFGIFFACIGFGLIAAAFIGYNKSVQQAHVQADNPDKPWVWKEDWAAGRANGSGSQANAALWVFAGLWDTISITVAANALPKLLAQRDPRALLVLIFPLIGIVITVFATRGTLRTLRYGRTAFYFESAPFSPGSPVKGSIHLKLPSDVPHGFDLTLSCKRRIVTGSGKNRTVQELVLWQDSKNVPGGFILRGPSDAEVPVEFAIPQDAYETDDDNTNDRVYWQLHAKADVPGIDFSDNYELPVFRTQASPAAASAANIEASAVAGTQAAPEEREVAAPEQTHIVFQQDASGPSFYFPPLRNHSQALGIVIFATLWNGAVYLLWTHPHVPWLFRIVFSLFDVLVGIILLNVIFGSARLRVSEGALEVKSAILGLGRLQRIPFDQVASVAPLSQGQATASGTVMYGILVRRADGREINVAANSLTDAEARWVVATLEAAMGRKQDTRAQFRSMYGPPPQRGVTSAGTPASFGTQLVTKGVQRKIGVVGFAVWLVIAGSMFFNVFHNVSKTRGAVTFRSGSARSRQSASLRMTSADVERIGGLPVQQQAEELLEHSVNHDQRALEIFEGNIENWTSQVRLTDRMKQLEARSRYSRDLRVRQANADLNLALQGWHRDHETVDLLLQRAETEPAFRPTAYYYLGMEGGRGVDSERVFAYLADRALHEQDAVARKWAVEGLQFFKSDEALEVLSQSFTTDPDYGVRDRAGCNVSDCGIFTRAQRMRYVPRLIDLSADPTLTPQMRNWVFMALGEITDASVPADPAAWRKWYQHHGADKAREFAELPWHEVRGDE